MQDDQDHTREDAPAPGTPRKRRGGEIAVAVLILVLAAAAIGTPIGWFAWSRWAEVPLLAGLSADDARAALEAAGLEMGTITEQYAGGEGEFATGSVLAQLPEAGARVTPRKPVELTIVAGPAWRPMPDVAGMNVRQAAESLASAEVSVSVLDPVAHMVEAKDASGEEASKVTSASIAAGGRLDRGAMVVLWIDRPLRASERRWVFAHPPAAAGPNKAACLERCHIEQQCSRCHLQLLGGTALPEGITGADFVRDTVLEAAKLGLAGASGMAVVAQELPEGSVRIRASVFLKGPAADRRSSLLSVSTAILRATVARAGVREVTLTWTDSASGRTLMAVRLTADTYWKLKWTGFEAQTLPSVADSYRESF